MTREIRFQCVTTCSSLCCGGATIINLKEINKLYKFFPITIGFRKVYPVDSLHSNYLQDITFKYKNFYIIGDFIAGNRFSKRCRLLKNSLCTIHGEQKPLQCMIIPFSITFPEEYQDKVIREKKKGAFKNCNGFVNNFPIVWDGKFMNIELKNNFYKLKEALNFQVDLMEKIFAQLRETLFFSKFIISKDGLFEVPLTENFIKEIFIRASIEDPAEFIRIQKAMFIKELTTENFKNSLFIEALSILDKLRI
ncbi:MAG: hypothetical protein N2647_04305 [Thermodesulfovibrio sp.]|nr:hypothetical protein [Thermodesulfovibrio sp.]